MPYLEITLQGHLLVAGGEASSLGVDLATARRPYGKATIPYIPGTALRGAIRIQLEALLAGVGKTGTGPYILDREGETRKAGDFKDPVARLFGFSGKSGERSGSREGALRFGDALPIDADRAAAALTVRPGVELDDYASTAADQKLYFREVVEAAAEPLVFRARLDINPALLEEGDVATLQAAAEATDSIGAGKSKGGGEISIRWLERLPAGDGKEEEKEEEDPVPARTMGDPETATRARLAITLLEPAHLGDGGPHGNHHATRSHIPGATLRGALAWALLRNGRTTAESPAFQSLFLGESPASFGDAVLAPDPDRDPVIHPATARERRGREGHLTDVLATELARDRINRALERDGLALYVRADDGAARLDPVAARPAPGLVRRTRTRVSINRHRGTAEDGRLFSIEQIEPWLADKKPASFVSWVEALVPETARLLESLQDLPVLIGAGRNHGLGLVQVEVRFEGEPAEEDPVQVIHGLAGQIDQEASRLAARAGVPNPSPEPGSLPLVLVALSDYVPSTGEAPHPLAEPELAGLDLTASEPVRRFLNAGVSGGYDQDPRSGAPLKDLVPAVGAGSVFVYEIARDGLADRLARLLPALRRGVGRRTESGCGRFALFQPTNAEETR